MHDAKLHVTLVIVLALGVLGQPGSSAAGKFGPGETDKAREIGMLHRERGTALANAGDFAGALDAYDSALDHFRGNTAPDLLDVRLQLFGARMAMALALERPGTGDFAQDMAGLRVTLFDTEAGDRFDVDVEGVLAEGAKPEQVGKGQLAWGHQFEAALAPPIAIACYLAAARLLEGADEASLAGEAWTGVGRLESAYLAADLTFDGFHQAVRVYADAGLGTLAGRTSRDLGVAMANHGFAEDAEVAFEVADEHLLQAPQAGERVRLWLVWALVDLDRGMLDASEARIEWALSVAMDLQDQALIGDALLVQGTMAHDRGRMILATRCFEDSAGAFASVLNGPGEAEARWLLGEVLMDRGLALAAEEALQAAAFLAEDHLTVRECSAPPVRRQPLRWCEVMARSCHCRAPGRRWKPLSL